MNKRKHPRGNRPTGYSSLNSSPEVILHECLYAEFREAGIPPPRTLREFMRIDKTRYYQYH